MVEFAHQNMLAIIYIFIITWIQAFLLHELCHLIEAYRQGARDLSIKVWFWKFIPSFRAEPDKITNRFMFALSGGLYSGILLLIELIISILTKAEIFIFPLLTVTITNLLYAPFEAKYLYTLPLDEYTKLRYLLYLFCILISVVIWAAAKNI